MGQSSIGKAALILGTNYGQVTSGLDQVYSKISGWKGKVSGLFGGGFAGLLGGKLFSDALGTAKELAVQGRQAKALGMTSDAYMGLGAVFKRVGLEGEVLDGAFAKLGKHLVDASFGNKEAATTFERLGLNVGELMAKRPDEQFLAVADAVAQIQPGAMQAHAAMAVFGKTGYQLLPILDQGAGKLKEFMAAQKALGTSLGEEDMAKLTKLRSAIPKVGAVFEGAWNKMVVAMAPALTSVAERFTAFMVKAQPFIDALVHGFERLMTIGGAALEELLGLAEGLASDTWAWVGSIFGGATAWNTVEDVVVSVAKGVAFVGLLGWEYYKSVAAVAGLVVGPLLIGLDGVKQTVVEILSFMAKCSLVGLLFSKQIDALAGKAKAADWKKLGTEIETWSNRQLAGTFKAQNERDLDAWFKRVLGKKDEVKKGLVAGIPEEFQAAGEKAGKMFAAAMTRGGKEDYSTRIRFEFGGVSNVAQQQLAEARKQTGLLDGVRKGTEALVARLPRFAGAV